MLGLSAAPASLPYYLWLEAQQGRDLSQTRGLQAFWTLVPLGSAPVPS